MPPDGATAASGEGLWYHEHRPDSGPKAQTMTTSNPVTLDAQDRHAFGHRNKALRRAGLTPLHVYGHGEDSLALQAGAHDVLSTLALVGRTTPLVVRVGVCPSAEE